MTTLASKLKCFLVNTREFSILFGAAEAGSSSNLGFLLREAGILEELFIARNRYSGAFTIIPSGILYSELLISNLLGMRNAASFQIKQI